MYYDGSGSREQSTDGRASRAEYGGWGAFRTACLEKPEFLSYSAPMAVQHLADKLAPQPQLGQLHVEGFWVRLDYLTTFHMGKP
jgi:hypothetical protein